MLTYNQNLKPLSQKLRATMTPQEIFLWKKINRKQIYGVQFYRQKPIGPFIVDFYSKNPKLVIEIDGGHHFEPTQLEKDKERDAFLKIQGFAVLRFDNHSVMTNWHGVGQILMDTILRLS